MTETKTLDAAGIARSLRRSDATRIANEKQAYAEGILLHYLRLVGLGSDPDYRAEIETAVEAIVEAARRPLEIRIAELAEQLAALTRFAGEMTRYVAEAGVVIELEETS